MNKRRFFIPIFIVLALATSCKNSASFEEDEQPYLNEVSFGEATTNDETVLLSDKAEVEITAFDEDDGTIIFSNNSNYAQNLSRGDIIISDANEKLPSGILRRVSRVMSQNGEFIVETEFATLEEAFTDLSISYNEALNPSANGKIIINDESKLKTLNSHRVKLEPNTFNITLENYILRADDFSVSDNTGEVTISGSIDIEPAIQLIMEMENSEITYFELDLIAEVETSLAFDVNLELINVERTAEFTIPLPIITIFAGPFPIVVNPSIDIEVGASGRANIGFHSEANASLEVIAGLKYDRFSNWSPVQDYNLNFSSPQVNEVASASAEAFVGPRLNVRFYGVVGPYVYAHGYTRFDANINSSPIWELYGGVRASGGISVDIIGESLLDFTPSNPFIQFERVILSATSSTGTIRGIIKNAISQNPLEGVAVNAYRNGILINSSLSNNSGQYEVELEEGNSYQIEFEKIGFINVIYSEVQVIADETKELEVILQIDEENAGFGNITGTIVNALTGNPETDVSLFIREGLNDTVGTLLQQTTTNIFGKYEFSNVEAGNYTIQMKKEGFTPSFFSIISIGNQTVDNQNATITPVLESDEYRIVLTWGENPSDLDSHLTGPTGEGSRFHIYFSNSVVSPYANLDIDDTSSFGPETITITEQIDGIYRYTVHDYTNRGSSNSFELSNSRAIVRLFKGSEIVNSFSVPSNTGGTLWTVFEINGEDLTPVNELSYESEPSSVQKRLNSNDASIITNIPSKIN